TLSVKASGDSNARRVARILSMSSPSVTVEPVYSDVEDPAAFFITEPTQATLGAYVVSSGWVTAARYFAIALGSAAGFDVVDDQFDWLSIGAANRAAASPLPQDRAYSVDLAAQSYLDVLKNEIRLNGLVLAPRHGRIGA